MFSSIVLCAGPYRASPECQLYLVKVSNWTPALPDETLLGDIQVEHVECMVYGFDLAHLYEPHLNVLGRSHQDTVTMVLGLLQHLQSHNTEHS